MQNIKDITVFKNEKPKKESKKLYVRENDNFKGHLKGYRHRMGLKQDEMAKELGIPYRTYQDYEEGKRTLLSKNSLKIMAGMGFRILGPAGENIL